MQDYKKVLGLLRWFCREDCIDELEGDLMEMFDREVKVSPRRATWMLRWRVLKYFRPEFLKLFHQKRSNSHFMMYKNYLNTAWRSVRKNKLHATLNVVGLSIGISACIVIYHIAAFELSFNRSIPEGDRIYRIYSKFIGTYEAVNSGVTPALQAMVKTEFTGVALAVNFDSYSAKVTIPSTNGTLQKTFEQQNDLVITNPEYFDLLQGFHWTVGDAKNALSQPFQVVLTEEKAAKYFGTKDYSSVIGREIRYQDSLVLYVTGIVQPPSYNTDFSFTDFISMATIDRSFLKAAGFQQGGWEDTNGGSQIFVKLSPGTSVENIFAQLRIADAKYKAANSEARFFAEYQLQPLSDLHFNGALGSLEPSHTANKKTLLILALIGFMLLTIAAINFINLETAQAGKRAKEVGVRKVLGGLRSQLFAQFLSQSFLITVIATALSVVLAKLSLYAFRENIQAGVSLHLLNVDTLTFLVAVVLIVGFLAGFYPAIVLSSFRPVKALKNDSHGGVGSSHSVAVRRGLIIFQFAFAQVLIIGTMVIISQIDFMLSKDLGFNKDAIITFHAPYYERPEKLLTLRTELQRIPDLEHVTMANAMPSSNSRSSRDVIYKTKQGDIDRQVYYKIADENYVRLFGLQLLSGRGLTAADTTTQVLINETYVRQLQLKPDEAIGQEIMFGRSLHQIVGVIKDFNSLSLREGLQPMMIYYEPGDTYEFAAKVHFGNDNAKGFKDAIGKMESAWKKVYTDEPFSPEFFDQTIANFYKTEKKMSRLTFVAMAIAILICCLGLFGLVSFNAASRTKEIGVRKVLGASVESIVFLLSRDIVSLVAIAFVIAVPVAYFAATEFLQGFTFRTALRWELFASAGVAAVFLALVTASYEAIKAAVADPVKSLRSE